MRLLVCQRSFRVCARILFAFPLVNPPSQSRLMLEANLHLRIINLSNTHIELFLLLSLRLERVLELRTCLCKVYFLNDFLFYVFATMVTTSCLPVRQTVKAAQDIGLIHELRHLIRKVFLTFILQRVQSLDNSLSSTTRTR